MLGASVDVRTHTHAHPHTHKDTEVAMNTYAYTATNTHTHTECRRFLGDSRKDEILLQRPHTRTHTVHNEALTKITAHTHTLRGIADEILSKTGDVCGQSGVSYRF